MAITNIFFKVMSKLANTTDVLGLHDFEPVKAAISNYLQNEAPQRPFSTKTKLKVTFPDAVTKKNQVIKQLDAVADREGLDDDFTFPFEIDNYQGKSGKLEGATLDDFSWEYSFKLHGVNGMLSRKNGKYSFRVFGIDGISLSATGIEPERGDDDMPRDWREREESATTTSSIATYLVPLGPPIKRTPLRFKKKMNRNDDCDCEDPEDCDCEDITVKVFPESFQERLANAQALLEGKSKGHALARSRRLVGGGTKSGQIEKKRVTRERRADERQALKSLRGKKASEVGDVDIKKKRLDPWAVS